MPIYEQALGIALIMLLGLLGGRLARRMKMPMVVGYVFTGLLLGPSLLNIIPPELNKELEIIKTLGLGIIALTLGGELEFKRLKSILRSIVNIVFVQVAATFSLIFSVMYFILGMPLPIALLLGVTATASAPASLMVVIKEYRAEGTFTKTLMGVVALLDTVCIIFFAVISAVVAILLEGSAVGSGLFIEPLLEIFGALLAGVVSGLLMMQVLRFVQAKAQIVVVLIGFALLNSGMAEVLHFSSLLANLVTGIVVANFYAYPGVFQYFEDIELPVYIAFFLLAGASLHLDVLAANWFVAAIYILVRGAGLVGGAYLGARFGGASETVQKYLGMSIFSKAGVTIGLILMVQVRFPEIAPLITAIELAAVAVCELLGPMGARYALIASGEAKTAA